MRFKKENVWVLELGGGVVMVRNLEIVDDDAKVMSSHPNN